MLLDALRSPFGMLLPLSGGFAVLGGFSPLLLFSSGQQGSWHDPSDLTTLFQDAAGTIPVTAVEQPVGLMRDKSGRGNHLVQAVATSRPIFRQNVGGKYYLAFDGGDDGMSSATGGGGTAGYYHCAALRPSSTPVGQREIWSDQNAGAGYITVTDAAKLRLYASNGAFPFVDAVGVLTAGVLDVVTTFDDGAIISAQITDQAAGSAARAVVAAGTAGFSIMKQNGGAANFFAGEYYGGVYVNGSGLTAAQRAQTKAYVRLKAGL